VTVPKPRMALVEVVAMNRLRPGVVVWAHVPYVDGEGEKTRPAIVVSTRGRDVQILPVTTKPSYGPARTEYVAIGDCVAAGLDRSSSVRFRPITVDRLEVVMVVGELAPTDRHAVLGQLALADAV